MITTLKGQDTEVDLASLNKSDIVESLTLQNVYDFLVSLGVDQIVMNEEKEYLICPTICHNPLNEAKSMKLYWYHNNKIFRCYTECNEFMSIFTLYQKFMAINLYPITLADAEEYVKHFLNYIIFAPPKTSTFELDVDKYKFNTNIPILPEYSQNILSYFSHYYHPLWLKDGITKEAMDDFKIGYSIAQNKIIIPHFDINDRLVGIRGRTLNESEIAEFGGKYRPLKIGDTMYAHQLHFNLYGINKHQEGIKMRRQAIIVEGEKSVLLDHGYYGKYSNAVACCGSSINKYHISMLTDWLGANEIIIAFDKEYTDVNSERAKEYRRKIEKMCRKYLNTASFSYIWDYDNLLNEKDSPFDKGKEIFEQLYKTRVKVR